VPGSATLSARVIGTYLRFLGLTLLNPATVVYFAALILALPDLGRGPGERTAFVAGAFVASLSWQLVLASVSAFAHHRLPPRFQVGVSILGNVLICGFAVLLALDL
jgi:threonine/homoserine/homoserine lactone efflux protein